MNEPYGTARFWREKLVSSRLLEYEVWTQLLHVRGLRNSRWEVARIIGMPVFGL